MDQIKCLFDVATKRLENVREAQRSNILKAAKILGDCMLNDGIVQLFGIDHGAAFAMELGYRAGGLMPFHKIKVSDLVLRGAISSDEFNQPNFSDDIEMAHKLWNLYNIDPRDAFILISHECNGGLINEFADMVKSKGHALLVVTSEKACSVAQSHHPSGKKLTDFADLVIDDGSDATDIALVLPNNLGVSQLSSFTGNVIAQMLCAEIYHYIVSLGQNCPILLSSNVKGADVHNKTISDKYAGRWNS